MSAYDIKQGGMHYSVHPGTPLRVTVDPSELRALRAHSRAILRVLRLLELADGEIEACQLEPRYIRDIIDEELARPEPGPVPPYSAP